MPTTTKANKAKGRMYQNYIAIRLMEVVPGKLSGQLMGQPGTDIIDHDKQLLWLYTDAKHWKNYPSLNHLTELMSRRPWQVFFVKANHKPNMVVLDLEVFLEILKKVYQS